MGTITIDENTQAVKALCKRDKRLARVIQMVGPITYSPHDEAFSFLVHEIVEQMLSVKAGQRIYARFEMLCNYDVTPEIVVALSVDQIKSVGMESC